MAVMGVKKIITTDSWKLPLDKFQLVGTVDIIKLLNH
jgi:hypothetical protein